MTDKEALEIYRHAEKYPVDAAMEADAVAYDALREKIRRDKGCERCCTKYTDWEEGAPHEFRISNNAIFYFDPMFGWEGEGIAFCPYCGRELKGEER